MADVEGQKEQKGGKRGNAERREPLDAGQQNSTGCCELYITKPDAAGCESPHEQ